MSDIKLWQGDCLELMKDIPDKSVHNDIINVKTVSNIGGFYPCQ